MKLKLDTEMGKIWSGGPNLHRRPDLVAMMAAEIKAGERAVSQAVSEAGNSVKSSWRAQITGAGLGQRLANTIRSEQFPKGRPSLSAASVIWSKAPVIIGAHDTGPLIRSKNGFWLAIPTPAAGKSSRGGGASGPANGNGALGCACASSIGERARVCWWPRDG